MNYCSFVSVEKLGDAQAFLCTCFSHKKGFRQVWNPFIFHETRRELSSDIEGIICTWFGGTGFIKKPQSDRLPL